MSEEQTNGSGTATDSGAATGSTPRNLSKTRVGVVVSDKMSKTIVVEVERRVPHPQFKKIVRKTTKFYAHDEEEKAKVGDKVLIQESRPLSKLKRWILLEVLAH
jgi:small subunit ribosomal protein S17